MLCNPITRHKINQTMTRTRWTILAFVLVAPVLALILSRRTPPPPTAFPARSPSIPEAKVKPQLEVTYGAAILLAPDGTLWSWGTKQNTSIVSADTPIPRQIGTNADWVQIACGFTSFALALKADGSLWGWGVTGAGQLGTPSKSGTMGLSQVGTSFDWALVRAGASHAVALKRDGSLWAWGQNDKGQVGDGTISNKFAPTLINNDRDWKQIDCGHFNSFGVKSNGTLWGWGLAVPSQSGNDLLVPTQIDGATNWSAISAGDYHLLALKSDGTLWLRGQNAHVTAETFATNSAPGFIQIGSDTDWREIFSGANNFYARKSDGSWRVCGQNHSGQLGIGHRQRGTTTFVSPQPLSHGPSIPAEVRPRYSLAMAHSGHVANGWARRRKRSRSRLSAMRPTALRVRWAWAALFTPGNNRCVTKRRRRSGRSPIRRVESHITLQGYRADSAAV